MSYESRTSSVAPSFTANEGLVRIQYKCLVPIYVFPEIKLLFPKQNYNVLPSTFYTHISLRDVYISRIVISRDHNWDFPCSVYRKACCVGVVAVFNLWP